MFDTTETQREAFGRNAHAPIRIESFFDCCNDSFLKKFGWKRDARRGHEANRFGDSEDHNILSGFSAIVTGLPYPEVEVFSGLAMVREYPRWIDGRDVSGLRIARRLVGTAVANINDDHVMRFARYRNAIVLVIGE